MNRSLLSALVLALSACATSSGVVKMGPDTYSTSAYAAPARGGAAGAKRTAYEDAFGECAKLGREMLVTNERAHINENGGGSMDLTFRCLPKGDPELANRPTYTDRPNVIIEDARKK